MKKLYVLVLGLFVFLLCVSSVNAGFLGFGEDNQNDGKNITLIKEITSCYIYTSSNDTIYNYDLVGVLKNIPDDAKGYTVRGTFYDGDNVVGQEERQLDYFSYSSEKSRPETLVSLSEKQPLNISKVDILVMDPKGDVVFTQSVPFNMYDVNNKVVEGSDVSANASDASSNNGDVNKTTSSSDSANSGSSSSVRYVASSNSDKFHSLSCSQADKIKDSNKITFSSREEAIGAGYVPCGLCKP